MEGGVEPHGREVVVVDQREVDLVVGQRGERLVGLVLVDAEHHRGVLPVQAGGDRDEQAPDRRREARHANRARRLGVRVQVRLSLQRLTAAAFGTLMGLEPAFAVLIGLVADTALELLGRAA